MSVIACVHRRAPARRRSRPRRRLAEPQRQLARRRPCETRERLADLAARPQRAPSRVPGRRSAPTSWRARGPRGRAGAPSRGRPSTRACRDRRPGRRSARRAGRAGSAPTVRRPRPGRRERARTAPEAAARRGRRPGRIPNVRGSSPSLPTRSRERKSIRWPRVARDVERALVGRPLPVVDAVLRPGAPEPSPSVRDERDPDGAGVVRRGAAPLISAGDRRRDVDPDRQRCARLDVARRRRSSGTRRRASRPRRR